MTLTTISGPLTVPRKPLQLVHITYQCPDALQDHDKPQAPILTAFSVRPQLPPVTTTLPPAPFQPVIGYFLPPLADERLHIWTPAQISVLAAIVRTFQPDYPGRGPDVLLDGATSLATLLGSTAPMLDPQRVSDWIHDLFGALELATYAVTPLDLVALEALFLSRLQALFEGPILTTTVNSIGSFYN